MKAITVRQPWASLIAAGVKTIETRPRRTTYRGRVAIHAGRQWTVDQFVDLCQSGSGPAIANALLAAGHIEPHTKHRTKGPYPGGVYYSTVEVEHDLPLGAVVASAVLTDCVPMVHTTQPRNGHCLVVSPSGLMLHAAPTEPGIDVSDQLPFGDFRPGRWALLLDDIKPTTERCPACWGDGNRHHLPDNAWLEAGAPLELCWLCKGAGRCDPIPARGQQAVPWEWTP